jgi:hypothetical protein
MSEDGPHWMLILLVALVVLTGLCYSSGIVHFDQLGESRTISGG